VTDDFALRVGLEMISILINVLRCVG
jgi:hypothetical protein